MLLNTMELSYIIEGAKLEKKLKRKEVGERIPIRQDSPAHI